MPLSLLFLLSCAISPSIKYVKPAKISSNSYKDIHQAIMSELSAYITREKKLGADFVNYYTDISIGERGAENRLKEIFKAMCKSLGGSESVNGKLILCSSIPSNETLFTISLLDYLSDSQGGGSYFFKTRSKVAARQFISEIRELEDHKNNAWKGQIKYQGSDGKEVVQSFKALIESVETKKVPVPIFLRFTIRDEKGSFLGRYYFDELSNATRSGDLWTLFTKNGDRLEGKLEVDSYIGYRHLIGQNSLTLLTDDNGQETFYIHGIDEIVFEGMLPPNELEQAKTEIADSIELAKKVDAERAQYKLFLKKEAEKQRRENEIKELQSASSIGRLVCRNGQAVYSGRKLLEWGILEQRVRRFEQKAQLQAYLEGHSPQAVRLRLRISGWAFNEYKLAEPAEVPVIDGIKASENMVIWDETDKWYFCGDA